MPLSRRKTGLGSQGAPILGDCLSTDAVGDFVYLTADRIGSIVQVETVDITDLLKMPAIGVIIEKPDTTKCRIQTSGIVEGVFTGLVPQRRYFIGTDGRLTLTAPVPGASETYYVQHAGMAIGTDALYLDLEKIPIKRVG